MLPWKRSRVSSLREVSSFERFMSFRGVRRFCSHFTCDFWCVMCVSVWVCVSVCMYMYMYVSSYLFCLLDLCDTCNTGSCVIWLVSQLPFPVNLIPYVYMCYMYTLYHTCGLAPATLLRTLCRPWRKYYWAFHWLLITCTLRFPKWVEVDSTQNLPLDDCQILKSLRASSIMHITV